MISILVASVEYTTMIEAVLGALVGVFGIVFVVLLGMLLTRNAADKRRLNRDEYKRELPTEKQIKEQKREKKKAQGEKKQRHGKKNKH